MPNWVFNTINNYPKELYEKYKNDEEDLDIDFNKIIPEPQEVKDAPSTSFNSIAKNIYKYNEFLKDVPDKHKDYAVCGSSNPLLDPVKNFADNTVNNIGHLAIANPDESLNQILEQKTDSHQKNMYDQYVEVFGNVEHESYNTQTFDKFIDSEEKRFQELRNLPTTEIKQESLNELGKRLIEVQEKYGFDNWYDWRVANWGTKWNAANSQFIDDCNTIQFDTAWAIPYPIISKIADENPDVKLDGYSEEETGWFDEYKTEDGKLTITGRGELEYDEDTDETKEVREAFTPITYTYDQLAKESIESWQNVVFKYK